MKINNGNGVLQRYAVKTFHSRKIFTTLANKEEMDKMRKYLTFILAIIIFAIIHEGVHALFAMVFEEYQAFQIHPYGFKVIFKTPVTES